jgi:hypothetical protein
MSKAVRKSSVTDIATGKPLDIGDPALKPMAREPEYIKLYVQDVARFFNIQAGHQEILLYIAASVDYEGIVSLTSGRKQRIAATVGQQPKSVENAIGACVKAGLLKKLGRGDYELDPFLFAKGEWKQIRERRAVFRMVTQYSADGGRQVELQVLEGGADQKSRELLEVAGQERMFK